jgi:Na+/melibiose symporter-like transporter
VNRRAATFLYVFAGWTVFVWVVFIRNIAKDHTHGTGFKVVHIVLAVISIAFAAGCFAVVARTRRRDQITPGDPATSGTSSGRPSSPARG